MGQTEWKCTTVQWSEQNSEEFRTPRWQWEALAIRAIRRCSSGSAFVDKDAMRVLAEMCGLLHSDWEWESAWHEICYQNQANPWVGVPEHKVRDMLDTGGDSGFESSTDELIFSCVIAGGQCHHGTMCRFRLYQARPSDSRISWLTRLVKKG